MPTTVAVPAYDIAAWRRSIPLLGSLIPMNNCSQAPQTDRTRAGSDSRCAMRHAAVMGAVRIAVTVFAYRSQLEVSARR